MGIVGRATTEAQGKKDVGSGGGLATQEWQRASGTKIATGSSRKGFFSDLVNRSTWRRFKNKAVREGNPGLSELGLKNSVPYKGPK